MGEMKPQRRSTWSKLWPPGLGVLALMAVGSFLEDHESLQPIRRSLQSQFAHRSAFPGNRTQEFFSRVGVLHPEPLGMVPEEERRVTYRGDRGGNFSFWALGPGDPATLPSSRKVPRELRDSGLPVISIVARKSRLRQLVEDPLARGRSTEIEAFVSFFDRGQLVFGSGAGIRLHGGRSRTGGVKPSFRLYLRDLYGENQLPPGVIVGATAEPIRRLVLDSDLRYDKEGNESRLANAIAMDIARQAGALAPATRPVELVINGEPRGLYVLTEYLDQHYLESRFGHSQFVMFRTKPVPGSSGYRFGDRERFADLNRQTKPGMPLAMETIAEIVDLENLSRWFIAQVICGAFDAMQGPLLLDETREDARWFWINWDMDSSFGLAWAVDLQEKWAVDVFSRIVMRNRRDVRSRILRGLIEGSPEFRLYLLGLFTEITNHRVNSEFLTQLLVSYEETARRHGLEDVGFLDRIGAFMLDRGPAVRERMGARLDGGRSHPVSLRLAADREIVVDGYLERDGFTGWYFERLPVRLRVPEGQTRDFSYWLVNGEKALETPLEVEIQEPTTVEAVFNSDI